MRSILRGIIRAVASVTILIIAALSYYYFLTEVKNLQVNPSLYSNTETLENALPAFDPTAVNQGQLPAIVRLEIDGKYTCTAFVISNDYAITAAHCVVTAYRKLITTEVDIVSEGRKLSLKANTVGSYAAGDLALLKGNFKEFKKLKINAGFNSAIIALDSSQKMIPLFSCGYPRGVADVICYSQVRCSPYFDIIACQGLLYRGMSGGPAMAYNPESQELVAFGLNSAMTPDSTLLAPLIGLFEVFNIKVVSEK